MVIKSINLTVKSPDGKKKGKKFKYKVTNEDLQLGRVNFKILTDLIPDEKPATDFDFIVPITSEPQPNRPPVITGPSLITAKVGTNVRIQLQVTDPDGNLKDISWTQIAGTPANFTLDADKQGISFTAPLFDNKLTFNVEAIDILGLTATKQIVVDVVLDIPVTCPTGQCKDPVTLQCRIPGINEIIDENGFCKVVEQPQGQLKLALIADDDTTNDAVKVRAGIKAENPDRVIFGGDGPYDTDGTAWTEAWDDSGLKEKLIISQGNREHEESESIETERDLERWWDAFVDANPGKGYVKLTDTPEVNPNESSWEKTKWISFTKVKNAAVISMNSQDEDLPFKRNQYNWMVKQLAKAVELRNNGEIDWIIAVIHKPWFTLKSSHAAYTAARAIYSEIFRQAGVDLLLSGHNHNLQLWKPMIANPTNPANDVGIQLFEMTPDGTAFDFTKDRGFIQIVGGNGGREHNGFREGIENHPNIIYANDTDFGYTMLYIDGKKMKVSAKRSNGTELKSFLISRGENKPVLKAIIKPVNPVTAFGQTVTLDGSLSTAASGFKWEQVSGDIVDNLTGSETPIAQFDVPQDSLSDYVFKLTVVNEALETSEATVSIKNNIPDPDEIDADAELLIFAKVGETVLLQDGGSTGPIVRHEWLKETPAAQAITLEEDTSVRFGAKFVATQDMVGKDIKFRLRVFNAAGNFDDDLTGTTVTITGPTTDVFDQFGMKILGGKPTGTKKAMEWGTDRRNGQRFNVNHEYHNYIMQGYYKLGQGQEAINHKGDGPNRGGCTNKDICLWYEFHVDLADGRGSLQYENPHPDNHNVSDSLLEVVDSVGKLNSGNWIGWATAYYWGPDGKRHMKAWVDPNPFDAQGKPLNNWKLVAFAIERGQIVTSISHPRDLQKVIDFDAGFESEIRMRGATNHDTDMKNAWVIELEQIGTPS